MRQVAVIGGGGFIGTNLCLRLAGQGIAVRALSRSFSPGLHAGSSIDLLQGSLGDHDLLRRALEGSDIVVHLALGSTPQSSVDDIRHDLQTVGAESIGLIEACRETGARLLFLSSGGTVYGVPRLLPTPEHEPCNPISPYGVLNVVIEKYLGVYGHLYGFDYRILRVANPYGPLQRVRKAQGVVAACLDAALGGRPIEIWGDGSVVRDYVYIGDVLDAIEQAAVHQGSDRVFNIGGGGGGVRLDEMIKTIELSIGHRLATKQRPARNVDVPVNVLDISLAGRELAWRPRTPLAEGIAQAWLWLQRHAR